MGLATERSRLRGRIADAMLEELGGRELLQEGLGDYLGDRDGEEESVAAGRSGCCTLVLCMWPAPALALRDRTSGSGQSTRTIDGCGQHHPWGY